jgi:uncharacterized protein (AIM24 family)
MFQIQTVNELFARAVGDGQGALFTKAGAMVGFRGQCKFEKVLLGPQGNPLGALLGQLGRRLTGENLPLMKVNMRGQAEVYLANMAQHVSVIDLSYGLELKVESESILAFTDQCKYGFTFLAQGVISQKGFFTSTLAAQGGPTQVAILTDGNPLMLDTPCNVDPDALVAWTGPNPMPKLDLSWKNIIGQASGESYNFEFNTPGHKVIIQPLERESGVKLGVDDNRYTPQTQQNPTFGNTMQSMNPFGGQQQPQNPQQGNTVQNIANTLGNLFR